MTGNNWNGQNIPIVHNKGRRDEFTILPVLEFLLEYNEDTVYDLLPSADSYGWGEDLMNSMAWANEAYKIVYFTPDFDRYGCLPNWFPTTDRNDRPLSKQGQEDRFLYLLDQSYGGLPDDHKNANPRYVVEAILQLIEYMIDYISEEESVGLEWELESGM